MHIKKQSELELNLTNFLIAIDEGDHLVSKMYSQSDTDLVIQEIIHRLQHLLPLGNFQLVDIIDTNLSNSHKPVTIKGGSCTISIQKRVSC